MTPHFTHSPSQGHWSYFSFCPSRISATVNIRESEYPEVDLLGPRVSIDFPGTFQNLQTEFQLLHVGRLLTLVFPLSMWQYMSKALFMFCWLSLCDQAESLLSPPPPPSSDPVSGWHGKKKGIVWAGAQHQQTSSPLHSSLTMRPGLSQSPSLSQQGRGHGERTEGAEERVELGGGGQWGNCPVTRHLLAAELTHKGLPGTWHHSPQHRSWQSHVVAALVPGEVWEGALGSSLEASPGAGRYLTTLLDFRPLPGVYFLTFDGMVRNHTFEPAGSHFRARLLIGEEERISLAALGILFSSLFPKTMACCHIH